MEQTVIRVVVIYLLALALMRFMGRSTVGQLSPYDLVLMIIIGSVAAAPLHSSGTSMAHIVVAMIALTAMQVLISVLASNRRIGRLLIGGPTILVAKGKVLEGNLARSGLSIEQLLSEMRSAGIAGMGDVEYAVLEPMGKVNVIRRARNRDGQGVAPAAGTPVAETPPGNSPGDGPPPADPSTLLHEVVVSYGQIDDHNLKRLGLTREQLLEGLRKRGVDDLSEVVFIQADRAGRLYVDFKDDFQSIPKREE